MLYKYNKLEAVKDVCNREMILQITTITHDYINNKRGVR